MTTLIGNITNICRTKLMHSMLSKLILPMQNVVYNYFLSSIIFAARLKPYELRLHVVILNNDLKTLVLRKTIVKIWLHYQTPAAESRYKIYKNKLTSILRAAEKEHYSKLLSYAKGNIKDTWTFLMQL